MSPDHSEVRLAPEPVVPVPALAWPEVRGARIIVGTARLGWRTDLRADAPVEQNERMFVPVLTEHDWYRAEAEQVEVFAPLAPLERVWIETYGPAGLSGTESPGVRQPEPVAQAGSVLGRRVVRVTGMSAVQRELRAVSEVRQTADGQRDLLVVPELEWYRWSWTGRVPRALKVAADELWVE